MPKSEKTYVTDEEKKYIGKRSCTYDERPCTYDGGSERNWGGINEEMGKKKLKGCAVYKVLPLLSLMTHFPSKVSRCFSNMEVEVCLKVI